MNPLSYFILAYQDVLYRNAFLSLDRLMVLLILTFVSLVLGYSLFLICKVRFAEEV
jgi:ABC-type polysaccharide/polyol phosphate export permease